MIEWEKEKETLEERKEFLKLEAGSHEVHFMDNGVIVDRTFKDETGKEEIKKQVQFAVKYRGEPYLFSVTKVTNPTSLYGQIAIIGASIGTLQNQTLTILVSGKGKGKRYTLPRALEITTKEELVKDEVKL